MGQGNLLAEVDLAYLDATPPNQIPASSISTSATTSQISIQWPAGTDNAGGDGIYGYQVYRNGELLTTTQSLSYVDTAGIVPSTQYNYTLSVLDYDMNATSTNFTVTTPHIQTSGPYPSSTPDGRRVGVRPTGAYWGGTNENIDVLSGNLNYTVPLLKAQARGGVSVSFNLVYNAQNWRQDSGGVWIYDGDVGYGFGWQLLAADHSSLESRRLHGGILSVHRLDRRRVPPESEQRQHLELARVDLRLLRRRYQRTALQRRHSLDLRVHLGRDRSPTPASCTRRRSRTPTAT